MNKSVIIVESYAKTKTISKYLDNKYSVICSLGHIKDLPKNELGIDTSSWKGQYIITNRKIVKNIRDCVKNCDTIYIASDPDVEGEAIAFHIKETIKDLIRSKRCYRIKFNDLSKSSIINALNNKNEIDFNTVYAQETRRFVDRLVGYKLSPLLWSQFNNNKLSVGRVQSIGLLLCVNALEKMKSENIQTYWSICAHSKNDVFKLYKNNEIVKLNEHNILSMLKRLDMKCEFSIEIKETILKDTPPPPYTTTTLQKDAYYKFKFNSKKTMKLAQELYENGLITYMRTDSVNISPECQKKIISFINNTYGNNYSYQREFNNKITNAQEAHEAIRITDVNTKIPNNDFSKDHIKLYQMIWKRSLACQMKKAEYIELKIILIYKNLPEYNFICTKSLLSFEGYLKVYDKKPDDIEKVKSSLSFKINKFTCDEEFNTLSTPYNEITLIKALEKNGIGRPSTYSSVMEKLIDKKYVFLDKLPERIILLRDFIKTDKGISEMKREINVAGKNNDYLLPTDLGINVIKYLQKQIPYLLDIDFTNKMEQTLDKIIDNSEKKEEVLNKFYNNCIVPYDNDKSNNKSIIKTKYGYCIYDRETKKYTNIESYLEWKNKSVDDLSQREIEFLQSLPKKIEDGVELHIGRYGLYVKEGNINKRLEKEKWKSFI